MSENIMTPEFRVSFPNLFRPSRFNEASDPKFSCTMLFPKDADLAPLKREAERAAKEKWGDKVPKGLKTPFRDQGDFDHEGYEPGAVFIRASSKQRPGVVDKNVQAVVDESEVYPGCFARATVRAYAYDVPGNKGIAFGLQNLQKLRDGDPIHGRSKPEDDFSPVGDEEMAGQSANALFE